MVITWNEENPMTTRRGGTEVLETNKGFKKIRTWQPERGEWKLTRLGKRYYRANPSNFIISLPVRYDVVRARDGSEVSYKGYFPVSSLLSWVR